MIITIYMTQLVLTLSNKTDSQDLYFDIYDTAIARKWSNEVRKNFSIYENDRFINWPSSKKDKLYYVNELNKQMQIVNEYAPGLIPVWLSVEQANQNSFNILHKFFEDTRGSVISGTPFYNNAPTIVQEAINRFNVMIHEFESLLFNEADSNEHPQSRLIVTFNNRSRHSLIDEDYDHFTINWIFGEVYINYCDVGKTIIDVLKDNDNIVGNDNIRPLRYYSADFQIKFAPTLGNLEHNKRKHMINISYHKKKEFFESLGFYYDKKLSLGLIPVAMLNRNDSKFMDMSDFEILSSLKYFDTVDKIEIRHVV